MRMPTRFKSASWLTRMALETVMLTLKPLEATTMNPDNVAKLRAICDAFGISVTAVADVADVSRPYASRVLHGNMAASNEFWRKLDSKLGALMEHRQVRVFEVPSVETAKLESLLQPK